MDASPRPTAAMLAGAVGSVLSRISPFAGLLSCRSYWRVAQWSASRFSSVRMPSGSPSSSSNARGSLIGQFSSSAGLFYPGYGNPYGVRLMGPGRTHRRPPGRVFRGRMKEQRDVGVKPACRCFSRRPSESLPAVQRPLQRDGDQSRRRLQHLRRDGRHALARGRDPRLLGPVPLRPRPGRRPRLVCRPPAPRAQRRRVRGRSASPTRPTSAAATATSRRS